MLRCRGKCISPLLGKKTGAEAPVLHVGNDLCAALGLLPL